MLILATWILMFINLKEVALGHMLLLLFFLLLLTFHQILVSISLVRIA
ncbi:hypothetical protein Gohar_011088 [Gossypium harknessii]|uniref:Uncharacterized protein n=1 Tax=Gossypium harknessii TaxID=34285 RepID=A0A7J9GSV0_9ROSI|nr:hypothetical protein [Gossypium harknessii]